MTLLQPRYLSSPHRPLLMNPSIEEELPSSWCQNCLGCTGIDLSFGFAYDVVVFVRPPSASASASSPNSTSSSESAASRFYFHFPRRSKESRVFLEVWDGRQWLRFPILYDQSLQLPINEDADAADGDVDERYNTTSKSSSPSKNMKMERFSDESNNHEDDDDDIDEETGQLLLHHHFNTTTKKNNNNDKNMDHNPAALARLVQALQPGQNRARFVLCKPAANKYHYHDIMDTTNTIATAMAPFAIHLWSTQDRVVIMDIDGSVTKSNIMGIVDTLITESYSHCHPGVCQFLSKLIKEQPPAPPSQGGTLPMNNNSNSLSIGGRRGQGGQQLRIFYLTSRPLVLANLTRKFVTQLQQDDISPKAKPGENLYWTLPAGPLIGFGGTLAEVLHMELITHSVHKFKQQALQDNVLTPWTSISAASSSSPGGGGGSGGATSTQSSSPFFAALWNTIMDVKAYRSMDIPLTRIGYITKASTIHVLQQAYIHSTAYKSSSKTPPTGQDSDHVFTSFQDPALLQYFQQVPSG